VEQVSFKSGMEERGSDGWCDGGDSIKDFLPLAMQLACDKEWKMY